VSTVCEPNDAAAPVMRSAEEARSARWARRWAKAADPSRRAKDLKPRGEFSRSPSMSRNRLYGKGRVYLCRMNAITASVTAASSSDRLADERPTRPLPRTAVQMAIAFASPGGHAGNNSQILSASLSTSALSSPLRRSASRCDGRPAPPRRTGTPPALSPAPPPPRGSLDAPSACAFG
jgi:hypothetical protein